MKVASLNLLTACRMNAERNLLKFNINQLLMSFCKHFLGNFCRETVKKKVTLWSLKQLLGSTKQFVEFADSTNTG